MKKLLLTLLTVLCLLCLGSALADPRMDCVAAVLLVDEEGSVFMGSAVLVDTGDGSCWVAPAALLKPDRYVALMMDDGTYDFAVSTEPLGDSGLARITLSGPLKGSQAVPLSNVNALGEESLSFIGFDGEGTLLSSAASRLSAIDLNGQTGLSFTGRQEGMLPGAVLSDPDAGLVAVTLSAWSEGEARYAALDAAAIRTALELDPVAPTLSPTPAPDGDGTHNRVTDAETRIEGGYLAVDLTASGIPTDGSAWVWDWYFDSANTYYTGRKVESLTDPVLYFPAVPGRSADLFIVWGTGEIPDERDAMNQFAGEPIHVDFPEATAMDRHEYRQDCWLAVTDAGAAPADLDVLPRAEDISRALLADEAKTLWLQITSSYTVTEDQEESLLLCLFTPDGQCLVEMASFLYGFDFMEADNWHYDMSKMFREAREFCGDPLPGGTYTLAYYIGDSLAGSFSFDLPSDTVDDGGSSL